VRTETNDIRLGQFKENFRAFLRNELEENGRSMVLEMTYRFAMVQFQNTEGFEPSRLHYIPKVLSDMQIGFGEIFEDFADYCFSIDISTAEINRMLRKWLIEILDEIISKHQD